MLSILPLLSRRAPTENPTGITLPPLAVPEPAEVPARTVLVLQPPPAPQPFAPALVSPSTLVERNGITLTIEQRDRVARELLPELVRIDAEMRRLTTENNPPKGDGLSRQAAEEQVNAALGRMEAFFQKLGIARKEGVSRYEYVTACMRASGYLIDVSAFETLIPGKDGKPAPHFVCQAVVAKLVPAPGWAIQTLSVPAVGNIPEREYSPAYIRFVTTGWSLSPDDARVSPERQFPTFMVSPSPACGPIMWTAVNADGVRARTEDFFRTAQLRAAELDRFTGARGALEAITCATFLSIVTQYPRVFQEAGQRGLAGGDTPLITVNDPLQGGKTVQLSLNQCQTIAESLYVIRSLRTDRNVPPVAANFFGRMVWRGATWKDAPPSTRLYNEIVKQAWKKTQTDLRLPAESDDQVADRLYHNTDNAAVAFINNLDTALAPFVEKGILPALQKREDGLAAR